MVKEVEVKEEKVDVRERFEKGWLDVVAIIEIVGKPADHIYKVMEKLIEGFSNEKDVKLIYKKVHEPKEAEQVKELFSTFAEIEFLAKSLSRVMEFVIDYMPSSIEIVAPKDLSVGLNDANSVLNDLTSKIHKYEAFMKGLAIQNKELQYELEKLKGKEETKAEEDVNKEEKECGECSCDECDHAHEHQEDKEHKEKKKARKKKAE